MSDIENQTQEQNKKDETVKFYKSKEYFQEYYKKNKDKVGVYTVPKYAKHRYRLSDDEINAYGEHICTYGKYLKYKKMMQEAFPDVSF